MAIRLVLSDRLSYYHRAIGALSGFAIENDVSLTKGSDRDAPNENSLAVKMCKANRSTSNQNLISRKRS